MRASTILVVTFVLWTFAKGTSEKYWALATTSGGASATDAAGGSANHAATSPATFSWESIWNSVKSLGPSGE